MPIRGLEGAESGLLPSVRCSWGGGEDFAAVNGYGELSGLKRGLPPSLLFGLPSGIAGCRSGLNYALTVGFWVQKF